MDLLEKFNLAVAVIRLVREGRRGLDLLLQDLSAPQSILLNLPAAAGVLAWKSTFKLPRWAADPRMLTLPMSLREEDDRYLVEVHRKKTHWLNLREKGALTKYVRQAGAELEWHGIRARALVADGRNAIQDALKAYTSETDRNRLRFVVMRPQPLSDHAAAYRSNVMSEVRFLIANPEVTSTAHAFMVTSNMVVDEVASLLERHLLELAPDAQPNGGRFDEICDAITEFDHLCRQLYSLAEFERIATLADDGPAEVELLLSDAKVTYRGLLSPGRFATLQVSMENCPGLVYSELFVDAQENEEHTTRIGKEAARARDASRGSFIGRGAIEHAQNEVADGIACDDTRMGSPEIEYYPSAGIRRTYAARVLDRLQQERGGEAIGSFDDWFRAEIRDPLAERMQHHLRRAALIVDPEGRPGGRTGT